MPQAENATLKAQIEKMKAEHQQSEEILKSNLQQVRTHTHIKHNYIKHMHVYVRLLSIPPPFPSYTHTHTHLTPTLQVVGIAEQLKTKEGAHISKVEEFER